MVSTWLTHWPPYSRDTLLSERISPPISTFTVEVKCRSKNVIEIACSKDKPEEANSMNHGMVLKTRRVSFSSAKEGCNSFVVVCNKTQ